MAEISIYGEIVPFKWFDSGFEYDLSDLNNALEALKDIAEGEELLINLHCPGGCTVTGFAIVNKLSRFKKEKKINITTRVDGYCASMGVAILLAGDKRIGNSFAEPFVHNAWSWVWDPMDKNSARKVAEELTRTDDLIATLYEQKTNITKEDALTLMDANTWLTPEQCMEKGFYTELEDALAPVDKEVFNSMRALRPTKQNNTNNNNNVMSNKRQGIVNKVIKFLEGSKNLVVFTAEQKELDFYELEEGDTPGIGDKATFDGKPAGDSNDGTYVMASGETYVFTGEELTTITPADDTGDDNVDLAAENAALKEEIANLKATETSNNLVISNLKKDLKTHKNLLAELAAVEADEEDETPKPEAGRQNKAGKKDEVLTRNLWAGIK